MLQPSQERIIASLADLGLTRTEAEIYLACVAAAADGPVSGYAVARTMGRDPANVGKVLGALTEAGAVQLVGDRPRLYNPLPLKDFSDAVLGAMATRRDEAVRLLAATAPPAPDGLVRPANGSQEISDRAEQLLASGGDALVCGSGDLIRTLGPALERAADEGRRVRVVSPLAFSSESVEICTLPSEMPVALRGSWLMLVSGAENWLVAGTDGDDRLVGWWSPGSPAAAPLRLLLELAARRLVPAETPAEEPPVDAPPIPEVAAEVAPAEADAPEEPELEPDPPEFEPEPPARPDPQEPPAQDEDDDGVLFLVKRT